MFFHFIKSEERFMTRYKLNMKPQVNTDFHKEYNVRQGFNLASSEPKGLTDIFHHKEKYE